MQTQYQKVKEFMQAFGQECPSEPVIPSEEIRKLRCNLIGEEYDELCTAKTRVEKFDAVLDLQYVTLGSAIAYGLPEAVLFPEPFDEKIPLEDMNGYLFHSLNLPTAAMWISRILARIVKDSCALGFSPCQFEAGFNEVHRSNMSKFWTLDELRHACLEKSPNVRCAGFQRFVVMNDSGKIIKSPSYSPANLGPILEGVK